MFASPFQSKTPTLEHNTLQILSSNFNTLTLLYILYGNNWVSLLDSLWMCEVLTNNMASTPLVFSTSFSSKLHQNSHTNKSHLHHRPLYSFPSSSSYSKSKLSFSTSKPLLFSQKLVARVSSEEHATEVRDDSGFVGEDAANFDLEKQKLSSWVYFTAILGVVLFVLNLIWIDDSTGFGKVFVDTISGISDSHEVINF